MLKTARAVCNGSLVEKKELLGALKKDPAFAKDGPFAKQAKLAMQFGSFQHVFLLRPFFTPSSRRWRGGYAVAATAA